MQSINRLRPQSPIALQSELSELIAARQQQIATGRRLEKPSDDPAAWAAISGASRVQANMDAWLRNIDRGLSVSRQAETAITGIADRLADASALLIQASSDTIGNENRNIIALEMDDIAVSVGKLMRQNNAFGYDC